MLSYGVVRPIAYPLFVQSFDASDILWGMALLPVLVTFMLWVYGVALSRYGPRQTLVLSSIVSVVLLLIPSFCHSSSAATLITAVGGTPVAWASASAFFLYVWKDAFIVLLVEQFWAFANSTNTVESGKKAFGFLLLAGGLGATAGNQLVTWFSEPWGTWPVYLVGVGVLVPFVALMTSAYSRERNVRGEAPGRGRTPKIGGGMGLKTLLRSRYLLGIAAVVGLGQVMVANLEVVWLHQLSLEGAGLDKGSSASGHFWTWVNVGSMSLQVFTPLIMTVLSVRVLHLLVPLSHLVAVGALIVYPSLLIAGIAFAWFKMVDYSIFRVCKEVLYVPLGFDARYRAKMAIDMVVYRTTKGGAGLLLKLAERVAILPVAWLPAVAAAAALAWLPFGVRLGKEFENKE